MAQKVGYIAPFINREFKVTSIFGADRTSSIHRGIDIATVGSASIYSISEGTVYYKGYDATGFGYYIIIKNNDGTGFLYAHMMNASTLVVGQSVKVGQYIGLEGSSGDSTGIHLHLMYQNMINDEWNYSKNLSDYLNPADYMKINNAVDGIWWVYDGTPEPTPKPPCIKFKQSFKWVLYARKLRKKQ